MGDFMIFWLCLLLVLVPLVVEGRQLCAWRRSVPCRIHIHGTRGKSATVRRTAALLREKGLRVLAKTTGDRPEYILPNGATAPVRRIGPASIREHMRILRMASDMKADALVVEGMALQKETVLASEQILRATCNIVTNLRPDHEETMGRSRKGVLRTLSLMLSPGATVYTAQETGSSSLAAYAAIHGVCCRIVDAPLSAPAQPEALARAAADDACRALQIHAAKQPLPCADTPSCGTDSCVPKLIHCTPGNMPVLFLDLFSVNDVVSARMLLAARERKESFGLLRVALLCTRADRPMRTTAFTAWLVHESFFDIIVLAGNHAPCAFWYGTLLTTRSCCSAPRPALVSAGLWNTHPPEKLVTELTRTAREKCRSGLFVAGLGNAHGYAERFRSCYGGSPCSWKPSP